MPLSSSIFGSMKYFLTLTFFFCCTTLFAQKNDAEAQSKDALLAILDLCASDNDSLLMDYVVYRGSDVKRKWKDVCQLTSTEERRYVRSVMGRIKNNFLPYTYELLTYHTEKESEGLWHVWEVKFVQHGEEKRAHFAFLKVKNRYALGDIDD